MITKKDFIGIADIFAEHLSAYPTGSANHLAVREMAHDLCNFFAASNAKFSASKFAAHIDASLLMSGRRAVAWPVNMHNKLQHSKPEELCDFTDLCNGGGK